MGGGMNETRTTNGVQGQKQITVGENIAREMESLNNRIAKLVKLREEAARAGVLNMPQSLVAQFAYPTNEPF